MLDLLKHFQKLHKDSQKTFITLPDIECSNKSFTNALTLVEDGCYPCGYEEQLLEKKIRG